MPLSEKWAESKIRGWADPEKKKKSDEDAEPFDNNTRLSIFQNGCIQIPDVQLPRKVLFSVYNIGTKQRFKR